MTARSVRWWIMAAGKFNRDSREWLMFRDYWQLCQQYWVIEDTDGYWHGFLEAVRQFAKKYSGDVFAIQLGIALINTFKERDKKVKSNSWHSNG